MVEALLVIFSCKLDKDSYYGNTAEQNVLRESIPRHLVKGLIEDLIAEGQDFQVTRTN